MFVKQDVDCDNMVQKIWNLINIELEDLHMNNGKLQLASYSSQSHALVMQHKICQYFSPLLKMCTSTYTCYCKWVSY